MRNGTEKYIDTIAYLSKLYDFCNEKFFGKKLKKPVITIQRDERNKSFGWWSIKKVWKENDKDEGEHELNITAQELNRPIILIVATLMHEMCHQYASMNDLQDTSRGGAYHNKLFRKIAESHGLSVKQVSSIGWSDTELTKESEKLLNEYIEKNPPTMIYRSSMFKGETVKSTSTRKYSCPVCGNSVRATKVVNILCLDCNQPMVQEQI